MQPSRCHSTPHSPPYQLEVVRFQCLLLQEDVADDRKDLEKWTLDYILKECINYTIKQTFLRIKYKTGEEDVYEGTEHKPKK